MPTKFISAEKILRDKGVKQKEFNTTAFFEVISAFYETHDVKDTILLRSQRFVEMEEPPEGDFIDCLDPSVWARRVDDPNDPYDFANYLCMNNAGLIVPTLIINEPFFGNAAALLRSLCGFTVKKRTRRGNKEFIVSLPI